MPIPKSKKLNSVCYDIRGPVNDRAMQMEAEGKRILKLNIGNPGAFGFDAPEELIVDIVANIQGAQGYTDSKGLFSARKAIMQETQRHDIRGVTVEDIYLGNGVSELIVMATQALLDDNDEVLIPSPDYPLWTAATTLAGGKAVHYVCDEQSEWQPDIADIKSKISNKTRAIVVINPNNPTGAVYSSEILESLVAIASEHNLVLFADEIYSKIIYDDAEFIPLSRLADNCVCITFNGLSKSYRAAGFRCGWMVVSGAKSDASDYILGLNMLASMRLCANVPAMHAIQTALGGHQSIEALVKPGGRLYEQRDVAYKALNSIPGVSCTKPAGALYLFPKIDQSLYGYDCDETLVLDFLSDYKILLAHGSAFNWNKPDHIRLVFLPDVHELRYAMNQFEKFLQKRLNNFVSDQHEMA